MACPLVVYGSALGFFLVLNALRFALSRGTGDITLFQADYALPPAMLWLAHRLRLGRRTTVATLFATTLLVLTIDAVFIAGRQFHWGPDAIPQYLNAYADLPWRIIAPAGVAVLVTAVLGTVALLGIGASRFAVWPLVLFLLVSAAVDARVGTSRFRDARGSVNIVATAVADLGPLYVDSLVRGGSLRRVAGVTMATALPRRAPPRQILSVAVESLGLGTVGIHMVSRM